MGKTLQIIGVLALVGFTGLGIAIWAQIPSKLNVTLSEGEASEDALKIALLRDRVETLSGDLEALTATLQENFTRLVEATSGDATETAAAQARTAERLRELEAAVPEALRAREERARAEAEARALTAALARLERTNAQAESMLRELDALRTSLREAAAAPVQPVVPTPPPIETPPLPPVAAPDPAPTPVPELPDVSTPPEAPAIPEPSTQPVAGGPEASGEDTAEGEPEKPKKKKSFLAFDLPSRKFTFGGTQNYAVLGALSRVGFDGKSTLHDFTGTSNRVSGSFRVDLANPAAGMEGRIQVLASSLNTGLADRDRDMRTHLGVAQHKQIVFVAEGFEGARSDPRAQTVAGTIVGKLTIKGTTRDVRMPVRARVDEAKRLVIEGELPIRMSRFGVRVPTQAGVISMEDGVTIWIRLRARARAGGR